MRSSLFLLFFLVISFQVSARQTSARREPGRDFRHYLPEDKGILVTASSAARLYRQAALPVATAWTPKMLNDGFNLIRNNAHLLSPNKPKFKRRIPWLYPDDGCFVRVELANSLLKANRFPVPKNIFAIGNLTFRTTNSPAGRVSWWYHVAPIVQVKGKYYVLDPAVSSKGPLSLQQWLLKIGIASKIKVAICGPGTSSPENNCNKPQPFRPVSSLYLTNEWNQLITLGKKPAEVLSSPWK